MKIAYLVTAFPSPTETFVQRQITGMIDRGHNVHIFAINPAKHAVIHPDVSRYALLDRTTYLRSPRRGPFGRAYRLATLLLFNIRWRDSFSRMLPLRLFKLKHASRTTPLRFTDLLRIALTVRENDPYDVIHCQFGTLGPLALVLRKVGATNAKLIVSFRGYDATKHMQRHHGIFDSLFREADLILPVSHSLAQQLIAAGCSGNKISVLHSGIDIRQFDYFERRVRDGESVKILTIARLVEKKGICYGLQAIAQLVHSGFNLRYLVVGDGILRGELEQQSRELGITDHICFLGWRDSTEVTQLLREAHILLAPSVTSADGDQEGIPNCLKEAMASGLPVVSTTHSGIPELVEDGVSGYLAPERDADTLAARISYLLQHPNVWPAIVRAARARIKAEFDIENLNDVLEQLYKRDG